MAEEIKPLEEMADDVKQGDLVRIFLETSDYIGYRWNLDKDIVQDQLLLSSDFDVIFCSLNPYGNTKMRSNGEKKIIRDEIQFVGINLKREMLGNERISSYEILERYEGPVD